MAKKLYVGNLSYDTTDDSLQELFAAYNPASVRIIRYTDTGRSKGFGFIEFENDADADKAEELNEKEFDGRNLIVKPAQPKEEGSSSNGGPVQAGNKLYVGNLSYDVDDSGLKDMFSKYGEIVSASIIKYPDTGKSKGFGFVEFTNVEDAEKAVELNGQEFDGRKVVVNMAKPKSDRREGGGRSFGGGRRGGFGGGNSYSNDDSYGAF